MKLILIIAMMVCISSCATNRNGCGTERDVQRFNRHQFRVQSIHKTSYGAYSVMLWNYKDGLKQATCDTLPDSVRVGRWISITL